MISMKWIVLVLAGFLYFIPVVAEIEEPRYDFGTIQTIRSMDVVRGYTYSIKLHFFNVYGNRVTHVTLSVVEAPPEWNVRIKPELSVYQWNISGVLTNVTENLWVEPMPTVREIPSPVPEGMEYITDPRGGGRYVPTKVAEVIFDVPEDAELKSYPIRVDAKADWYGQAGMVTFSQARSFSFTVRTVLPPGEYYEVLVTPTPAVTKPLWEQIPLQYVAFGILIFVVLLCGYYLGRRRA
jgi:hypothetical protein